MATSKNEPGKKAGTNRKPLSKNSLNEIEKELLILHHSLKLQIELVPQSCWWSNVRSNVTKVQWDKVRKAVYSKANCVCEICGENGKTQVRIEPRKLPFDDIDVDFVKELDTKGTPYTTYLSSPTTTNGYYLIHDRQVMGNRHPVECHEVWLYDDQSLTQSLGYFQALCPLCHEVKHIGLASNNGYRKRAFDRFKRINQLEDQLAKEIVSAVFKEWEIRSKLKWNLDIEHLRAWGIDPSQLGNRPK